MTITENQIDLYKNHLVSEEKCKVTIEKYIRDITAFSEWIADGERALTKELKKSEFLFGPYLRAVRKALNISIRALAKEVGKTPTYISDIENCNNKPPEKELLEKIVTALNLDEYYSPKLKNTLFDLAAKERNEVSCDIKDYIMDNKKVISLIRKLKDTPDSLKVVDEFLNYVTVEVM